MQGDKGPPSIKLPSFKDIQQNAAKRSRLQSTFDGSRGPGRPQQAARAAAAPIAPAPRPQLPPIGATAHAAPPAMSRPALAPAVQPVRPPPAAVAGPQRQQPLPQQQQQPPAGAAQPLAQATAAPAPQAGPSIANHSQSAYSSQVKTGNAILVNKNQQGNPLLKQLRNINYRFATIIPDYQFNDKVRMLGSALCKL